MRRLMRTVCGVGALLMVLWKFVDGSLIYSNATTDRNVLTGYTVSMVIHGRELFITPDQSARLSPLHWTTGVLVVLLIGFVIAKVPDKD